MALLVIHWLTHIDSQYTYIIAFFSAFFYRAGCGRKDLWRWNICVETIWGILGNSCCIMQRSATPMCMPGEEFRHLSTGMLQSQTLTTWCSPAENSRGHDLNVVNIVNILMKTTNWQLTQIASTDLIIIKVRHRWCRSQESGGPDSSPR